MPAPKAQTELKSSEDLSLGGVKFHRAWRWRPLAWGGEEGGAGYFISHRGRLSPAREGWSRCPKPPNLSPLIVHPGPC